MKNDFFELISITINDDPIPTEYIMSFVIYSSIEQPALQLNLLFNDKTDMKNLTPLKGGETMNVSIVDKYQKQINLIMTITKVETLTQKESDSTVQLKSVSKNGLWMATQRVHRSYEATPSEIVKSIADFIDVTQTVGVYPIMASGWTMTRLIQKLTTYAYNEKYKAMYMFYEDFNGIHFKPMNQLLDVKKVNTYKINDANTNYRYNIIEWHENKTFDITENAHENNYDNTHVHYNPDNKQIYTKQVKIKDAATESASLGKGQIFHDDLADQQGTKIVSYIIESEEPFYPKVYNQMSFALYSKQMQAVMNGDFSLQVGTLINVNMADRYNKAEFATESAGLWFVETVAYHFTPEEFKMKVLFSKNATYSGAAENSGAIVNPTVELN